MRIFHWGAVLGTGAALRTTGTDGEAADALPGTPEEATPDARATRGRTGPLPRV